MIKTVFDPHRNRQVKFGRRRPTAVGPHLRLRNYLRASLPTPPSSCDFTQKAASVLSNIYLNDTLGDCGIAGGYHIVGVETGNAGNLFTATSDQIVADYSAIGGYVPGDEATDGGIILQNALNYWSTKGFADGTKLLGYLSVDATNLEEVQSACYLFENLYLGLELPDAYVNPFPSGNGFTWGTGTPNPQNGHCIIGGGYNSSGVTIATWGLLGTFLWRALQELCVATAGGELWVLLTPDQLAKGQDKAPNGVAWLDLISDFDAMGGHVPLPAPPPPAPPAPTPAPGAVVTLAQAQGWAMAGLAAQRRILTREQAESAVQKSLAAYWPASS